MPSSLHVGTLATSPPIRFGAEIASMRSLPACTCLHVEVGVAITMSTCPPITAVVVSAAPLNETNLTFRRSTPAAFSTRPAAM